MEEDAPPRLVKFMFWGGTALSLLAIPAWRSTYLEYRTSIASVDWPSADGVMGESRVALASAGGSSGGRSGGSGGGGGATYELELRPSHMVGDVKYACDRVAMGGNPGGSQSDAEEGAQRYPVGRRGPVFCDPDSLASCLLQAGVTPASRGGPFFTLLLALRGGRDVRPPQQPRRGPPAHQRHEPRRGLLRARAGYGAGHGHVLSPRRLAPARWEPRQAYSL